MTGVFQIYIKRPRVGEVAILSPKVDPMQEHQRFPDMKDSNKFEYQHLKDVENFFEAIILMEEWFAKADFCEEFIVRCELPT